MTDADAGESDGGGGAEDEAAGVAGAGAAADDPPAGAGRPDSPDAAATISGVAHNLHSDAVLRFSAPQFGHVFIFFSVLILSA